MSQVLPIGSESIERLSNGEQVTIEYGDAEVTLIPPAE